MNHSFLLCSSAFIFVPLLSSTLALHQSWPGKFHMCDDGVEAASTNKHCLLHPGNGRTYSHGASGSHTLEQETLNDAVVREAGDIGRRPATELMDGGHEPQLHFDLDQMLGVDQENGLPQSGGMDIRDHRMMHRYWHTTRTDR